MTKFKGLFAVALSGLVLSACTVAPKGEYTRTEIDRPYTLNEDVAKVALGAMAGSIGATNSSDSATGESERENQVFPFLTFENGITPNFTYVFPVGLRYQIFRDDNHTLGVSAATLILFGAFSLDYWYRISPVLSVRPYWRSSYLNLIIVEERRQFGGTDLVFQANKYWSFNLFGQYGKYQAKSELLEAVIRGITNSDDLTIESTGNFWSAGFGSLYSLSDTWDVQARFSTTKYDLDVDLTSYEGQLGFNYYW